MKLMNGLRIQKYSKTEGFIEAPTVAYSIT